MDDVIEYRMFYCAGSQSAAANLTHSSKFGIGFCEQDLSKWYNGYSGEPCIVRDSRACVGSPHPIIYRPYDLVGQDNIVVLRHWWADSLTGVMTPAGTWPDAPEAYFRIVPRFSAGPGWTGTTYHYGGDLWCSRPSYRVSGGYIAASTYSGGTWHLTPVAATLDLYYMSKEGKWVVADVRTTSDPAKTTVFEEGNNYWTQAAGDSIVPQSSAFTKNMTWAPSSHPWDPTTVPTSSWTSPGFLLYPETLVISEVPDEVMPYWASQHLGAAYSMAPGPHWIGVPP